NDMLVGAPGHDLRNLFDFRTGAVRNPLRDFDVGPGWPYPKQRHRPPLSIRENPDGAGSFLWSASSGRSTGRSTSDIARKRRGKTPAKVVIMRGQTNICAAGASVSKRLAAACKIPA